MRKKSFDILSPKYQKKQHIVVLPKKEKGGNFKKVAVISFLVLLGVGLVFYLQPKAKIEIYPKSETLTFKTKIKISPSSRRINLVYHQIPGKIVEIEKTVSQQFSASGKVTKEEKAKGVIRVYNNYHLNQILVKNTRFWCVKDGKVFEFKTKKRIVIPPKSSLDVEVVASKPGPEYNIPPCIFSVPGLKGTPRYTYVYGKSFSSMEGGSRKEVFQITEDDVQLAKEVIKEKILKECNEQLKEALFKGNYILVEGAKEEKIEEINVLGKPGDVVEKFSVEGKGWIKGIVFKKSDLERFAKRYFENQIPQEKKLKEDSIKVEYSTPKVDLKNQKIELLIEISGKVYPQLEENIIFEKIKGKSLPQAERIIAQTKEIDNFSIKLTPFFVKKIPSTKNRVFIEIIEK